MSYENAQHCNFSIFILTEFKFYTSLQPLLLQHGYTNKRAQFKLTFLPILKSSKINMNAIEIIVDYKIIQPREMQQVFTVVQLTLYCVSISVKQLFTAAKQSITAIPSNICHKKKLAEVKNLTTSGCEGVGRLSVLNFIHEYLIHI